MSDWEQRGSGARTNPSPRPTPSALNNGNGSRTNPSPRPTVTNPSKKNS